MKSAEKITENFEIDFKAINTLFNKKIIKVYDAYIIEEVEEDISIESIKNNFDELIHMNTDLTGYECSVNDFRLVDAFDKENFNLSSTQQFVLGRIIMRNLISKKNFPTPSVVYFTFDEGILSMRFHKYRPTEGLWVSKELENYEEPVGYFFIDSLNDNLAN